MNEIIDSRRIAKNIRELRINNKLTLEELADSIGYSLRHIMRFEKEGTMNLAVVNMFARFFNVSVKSILFN